MRQSVDAPRLQAPPVATNRIITAAGITQAAKLFEQPDQRQPFPRLALIRRQLDSPGAHLRLRLRLSLELRRLRTDDLANHLPRHAEFSADRLDRTTIDKIGATDLGNRFHHQHSNLGFHDSMEASVDPCPPPRLDADHPENGVLIPRRNTVNRLTVN
jgi:hypothetical protein